MMNFNDTQGLYGLADKVDRRSGADRRSECKRRVKGGFLLYFIAGGSEGRTPEERRRVKDRRSGWLLQELSGTLLDGMF